MERTASGESGLSRWLDERMGLSRLVEFSRDQAYKPVPRKLSWAYTLGTLGLFFFGLQFFTGFLLLMHYAPDAEVAYRTVQDIQHRAEFGWLFRQMHSWGASFVVIVLALHMAKVLWYGSYKRPREFTWFIGVVLFALTLTFCFTGYILPWNQLAKWATAVGTDAIGKVPGGTMAKQLILGGNNVTGETIGRFFAVHVYLLPTVFAVFVVAHLVLIRWKGMATRLTVTEETSLGYDAALEKVGKEPFFPRQVYKELLVMIVGFAVLVTVATFFPFELGEPASPRTPEGVKPEWYFLPVYQLLKYFEPDTIGKVPLISSLGLAPELIGLGCINLFVLILFFLPILDRGKQRRITRRPFFALLALAAVVAVVGLGVLGYISDRSFTVLGKTYAFDIKGFPIDPPTAADAEMPATPPDSGSGAESDGAAGPDDEGDPEANDAEIDEIERADGRPLGGTCGDCHRRERRNWQKSVHAGLALTGQQPVECMACHGGLDMVEDEVVAHQGMLTVGNDEGSAPEWRPPAGQEVVDVCGECHLGVKAAFSDLHLGQSPEVDCHDCHSNHDIQPAGLATFERTTSRDIYTEAEDSRTALFRTIEGLVRDWEETGRPEFAGEIASGLARLRSHEYPVERLEADLDQIEADSDREISEATHSLDADRVGTTIETARGRFVALNEEVHERVGAIENRWIVVAAVWAVTLLFGILIGFRLRGFGAASAPAADPDDTLGDVERQLSEIDDADLEEYEDLESAGEEGPFEPDLESESPADVSALSAGALAAGLAAGGPDEPAASPEDPAVAERESLLAEESDTRGEAASGGSEDFDLHNVWKQVDADEGAGETAQEETEQQETADTGPDLAPPSDSPAAESAPETSPGEPTEAGKAAASATAHDDIDRKAFEDLFPEAAAGEDDSAGGESASGGDSDGDEREKG